MIVLSYLTLMIKVTFLWSKLLFYDQSYFFMIKVTFFVVFFFCIFVILKENYFQLPVNFYKGSFRWDEHHLLNACLAHKGKAIIWTIMLDWVTLWKVGVLKKITRKFFRKDINYIWCPPHRISSLCTGCRKILQNVNGSQCLCHWA